jgi:fatty acid desaturase
MFWDDLVRRLRRTSGGVDREMFLGAAGNVAALPAPRQRRSRRRIWLIAIAIAVAVLVASQLGIFPGAR